MNEKKIERINELAKLAKVRDLTETETAERVKLREEYIKSFRSSLTKQLDNVRILDKDGKKSKLKKKS